MKVRCMQVKDTDRAFFIILMAEFIKEIGLKIRYRAMAQKKAIFCMKGNGSKENGMEKDYLKFNNLHMKDSSLTENLTESEFLPTNCLHFKVILAPESLQERQACSIKMEKSSTEFLMRMNRSRELFILAI